MAAVSLLERATNRATRRSAQRHRGQPLPLHRLRQHRQGHQGRGRQRGGGEMAVTETQTTSLIGAPVRRVEDARLITGAAKFVDNIRIPGMVHAAILPLAVRARAHQAASTLSAALAGAGRRRGLSPARTSRTCRRCRARGRPAGSRTSSTRRGRWRSTVPCTPAPASPSSSRSRATRRRTRSSLIEVDWEPLDDDHRPRGRGRGRRAAAPRERAREHRHGLGVRRPGATDAALAEAEMVVRQRLATSG